MYFDRMDIVEAYWLLLSDWNMDGIVPERYEATGKRRTLSQQLSRLGFVPAHDLAYDTLTENGQEIYNNLVDLYELLGTT